MNEQDWRILPPRPLEADDEIAAFANGRHPVLDEWLAGRARGAEGASARTYVVTPVGAPGTVVGYYCLSAAMAQRAVLPTAKLRKDMPDSVPLVLIGRLAIDGAWQGRGLGSALLIDAVRRSLAASAIIGARAIIAHAIDEQAARFYAAHGFLRSPLGERTLVLPIETAAALAASAPAAAPPI